MACTSPSLKYSLFLRHINAHAPSDEHSLVCPDKAQGKLEAPALVAVLTSSQDAAARLYAEAAETALQPVPLTVAERRMCNPSDATITVLAGIVSSRVSAVFVSGGGSSPADEAGRGLPIGTSPRTQGSIAEMMSLFRVVSMNLHAALHPCHDGDGTDCGRRAFKDDVDRIQVSSGSQSCQNMLESSSQVWQSSGGSPPHWVTIDLKEGLVISAVELETYSSDSYCPSRVKLEFTQKGEATWKLLPHMDSIGIQLHGTRTHSLVNLGDRARQHGFTRLRLTILENHNGGGNSRIKSIHITVAPTFNKSKAATSALQTATADITLESAREAAAQVVHFRRDLAAGGQLDGRELVGR